MLLQSTTILGLGKLRNEGPNLGQLYQCLISACMYAIYISIYISIQFCLCFKRFVWMCFVRMRHSVYKISALFRGPRDLCQRQLHPTRESHTENPPQQRHHVTCFFENPTKIWTPSVGNLKDCILIMILCVMSINTK